MSAKADIYSVGWQSPFAMSYRGFESPPFRHSVKGVERAFSLTDSITSPPISVKSRDVWRAPIPPRARVGLPKSGLAKLPKAIFHPRPRGASKVYNLYLSLVCIPPAPAWGFQVANRYLYSACHSTRARVGLPNPLVTGYIVTAFHPRPRGASPLPLTRKSE